MAFTLTTERLILHVENNSKAAEVLNFYTRNKHIFEPFEPTRPTNFYTLSYQKASMEYEFQEIMKGKTLRYYIYLREDPEVIIGSVNFSNIQSAPFSRASIGYKLDEAYQGYGYAYEACEAAIASLFEDYRLHRIDARIAPENISSIKLIERLGFVYEGIEYQGVEVNGSYKDHYRYGLISTIQ